MDKYHWPIDYILGLTLFEIRLLTCDPEKLEARAKHLALSDEGKRLKKYLDDNMGTS